MDTSKFSLDPYLERVQDTGPVQATEDRLETLHRAQAYTIPFENFDILLGRGINLDPTALYDKLVLHQRGGYCFELNGLFLMALHAFGFEARPLLARVHLRGEPTARTHELILVNINGHDWIADVGFGGPGLRAPIPFELNHPTTQDGLTFQLIEAYPYGIMLQSHKGGQWLNLYSFDLGHVFPADIALGNHFTSTHPGSFFTFARVAALPRPDGRVALFNCSLTHATPESEYDQVLTEGPAYVSALKTHFSIELEVPYEALQPLPKP